MTTLIVGASSSLGRSITQAFLDEGAEVVATSRSGVLADLEHPALEVVLLDLVSEADASALVERLKARSASITNLIFVAGVLPGKPLSGYTRDAARLVMDVNFTGQATLLTALLPVLQQGGHVLMISSISGQAGSFDPIYAASKGAILAFVKAAATWLAPAVRVNALAPGLIEGSSMWRAMAPERREHHRQKSPMRALAASDDVARVVVDLCRPHWRHLNGATIDLNGGEYVR